MDWDEPQASDPFAQKAVVPGRRNCLRAGAFGLIGLNTRPWRFCGMPARRARHERDAKLVEPENTSRGIRSNRALETVMTGNPVNLKTTPVPFSTPPLLIDQTVNWSLTTPFGIAYGPFSVDNPFAGVWNSGHLNDVVLCPTNVPPGSQTPGLSALLVGADAAGVWNVGAAISVIPTNFDPDSPTAPTPTSSPYSHNWDAPGTVCLCRGLEPEHVYAGTGDVLNGVTTGYLYETVATNGVYSLSTWRLAPNATGAPTNFETIYRILVVKGAVNRIVMATNIGVYWSVIPAPSGNYDWQHVTKLANGKPFPLGAYSSVAAAPDGVVVAAYGDGAGHSGIFYGDWSSGELTMTLATVPAAAQDSFTTFDQNMYRISLAASARQPSVIYAIGSAIDDTIYAILVSQDGGKTWTKPYDPQNQSVARESNHVSGCKARGLFTKPAIRAGIIRPSPRRRPTSSRWRLAGRMGPISPMTAEKAS